MILSLKNIRIEQIGASSKGGQKANRKRNIVRMTHMPTGIRVVISGRATFDQKRVEGLRELGQRVAAYFAAIAQKKKQAVEIERRRKRAQRKTARDVEYKKRVKEKKVGRRTGRGELRIMN